MGDPGFDEFMFSENYKEIFDQVPPVECPNRSECVSECPCLYVYRCKVYNATHKTGNVKAEYDSTR